MAEAVSKYQKFRQPPDSTSAHVFYEGGPTVSERLKGALSIFRNHSFTLKDELTVKALQEVMDQVEKSGWQIFYDFDDKILTARSFWPKHIRDEKKVAQELELEGEAIGEEAGVYWDRFAVKPISVDLAQVRTKSGLWAAYDENKEALQRIFRDNADQREYDSFSDRLKWQWLPLWVELLCENIDSGKDGDGLGHKDWDICPDPLTGKAVARKDPNSTFQVKAISKKKYNEEITSQFEAMAGQDVKEQPVARVLLLTNESNMVDEVVILYTHFANNQAPGQAGLIFDQVSKHFVPDNRPLEAFHLNRCKSRKDSQGEYLFFDMSYDWEMGKNEAKLIKRGQDSVVEERDRGDKKVKTRPSMMLSVFAASVWLGMTKSPSCYICVNPNTPRKGDKRTPSELTMVMVPGSPLLNSIKPLVDRFIGLVGDRDNLAIEKTMKALRPLTIGILDSFIELSVSMSEEIGRAKQALSTIAILDTSIPNFYRALFKYFFNEQDRFVSEGTFQVSSVTSEDHQVVNRQFSTAMNIFTTHVLSILNFIREGKSFKKSFNLRARTTRQDYEEVVAAAANADRDSLLPIMQTRLEEKAKNYRFGMALYALAAAEQGIRRKYAQEVKQGKKTGVLGKIDQEISYLYALADKALTEIRD